MKKTILAVLVVIMCLCSVSPCFALDNHLYDNAGLLTEADKTEVENTLTSVSERQQFDIVIVTTNDLNGKSTMQYADDFYDMNNRGYGDSKNGILLLIDMGTREYYISTCGFGITAFNDNAIAYTGDEIVSFISDGDYYGAFNKFINICDDFVTQAKNGKPVNPHKKNWVKIISIGLAIGIVAALIVVTSMKSKLKTATLADAASDYVKEGSLNLTANQDIFLYSTISRTQKESNKSGSSTHTSSSGRTHGGGGGSF